MSLVYENLQVNDEVSGGANVTRAPVRAATTANGVLATAYENGDTIDGVVLATGNRILLKNQTTGSENGLYIVNATGTPTRTADYDAGSGVGSTQINIQEGTANASKVYLCTNISGSDVVGTDALTYTLLGPASAGFSATTYVTYAVVGHQDDLTWMTPADSSGTTAPINTDFGSASSSIGGNNNNDVFFALTAGESWKFTIDGYVTLMPTPPNSLGWRLRQDFGGSTVIETAGPSQAITSATGGQGWTMNFIATITGTGDHILELHNDSGDTVRYGNVRIIAERIN